jgi:hypothetical protein
MKKNIILTIFFLLLCAALNAQTADEIQTLMQTPAVSYAQAARFVLEAAEVTGSYDKKSGQDAVRFAIEKNWLPQKAGAQDVISLEELSLLIMRAFNLTGGPMYNLFHNAHYSYREMVFKNLIQGRTDPQMKVSGYTMILIVNRLLFLIEKDPWKLPEQSAEIPVDLPEDKQ